MKNLITLTFLLFSIACSAQFGWSEVDVTDEFGDKIEGKTATVGIFKDKFSNSATNNASLLVKIQPFEDGAGFITLYEYNKKAALLPNKDFIKLKVKKSDDTIIDIELFCSRNKIYDSKGTFINLIKKEEIKVSIDLSKHSKYLNGRYVFEVDQVLK